MSIVRVLGIVGLIALLILGAWGIIIIAVHIPAVLNSIASLVTAPFRAPAPSHVSSTTPQTIETVSVTGPAGPISSGSTFTINWSHTGGAGAYGYTVAYSCVSGLSLEAPLPNGTYQKVSCGTRFNYTNAQNSMTLKAAYTGTSAATSQITVYSQQLSTGTTTAAGAANVSFAPAKAASSGYASKGGPSVSKGGPTGSYIPGTYGYPDLAVELISIQPGYAQFRIQNNGTRTVPYGWIFTANMPGQAPYTSAPQRALTPGSGIINTLTWSGGYQYQYGPSWQPWQGSQGSTFSVTADPYDYTGDPNFYNNTITAPAY